MAVEVTGLFDTADLLERCLHDVAFAEEMLGIFATQAPQTWARLESAFRAGNRSEAAKAAHSLKGSAGNLSARLLHGLTIQFEKSIHDAGCTAASTTELFERCREVCRQTIDAIPATLAHVKSRAAA